MLFSNFENLTGGENNDRFIVAAGGRLTGKLLGTSKAGHVDSDQADFSSQSDGLTFNITARNAGLVENSAETLADFSSIESVVGGAGDDHFIMAAGSGLSGLTDGGQGTHDHLDFSQFSNAVSVNLSTGVNQLGTLANVEDVTGSAAGDTITGSNVANRLIGLGGSDSLHGLDGDDVLIGDSAIVSFSGNAIASIRLTDDTIGNDTISAGNGNNWILAGLGNDAITSGSGNNFIASDLALLNASGGLVTSLESLISGTDGNDSIISGAGNDVVIGGNGSDSINAGGGRNVVSGDRGSVFLNNGVPTTARSFVSVLSGVDLITTGNGIDSIFGGGNGDTINAGSGNNVVLGDDGAIIFSAGNPNAIQTNPSTNDGNDTITTLFGNDVIHTGDGDNIVNAGDGHDDVFGGTGKDTLNGQSGDDFLVGSLGDDTLDGGSGNDVMFGGQALGTRSNYELNTADFTLPPQYATVEALFSSSVANFGLPNITSGAYVPSVLVTPAIVLGLSIDGVALDGRDVLLGAAGNDILFGGSDVDELQGGSQGDYLDAGSGNDIDVDGGDGDDVVRGGTGHDVLHGGLGIDNVYGDDGDDYLFGDAGADTSATAVQAGQRLFGGSGRDELFAFAPAVTNLTQFNAQLPLAGDQIFEAATAISFMAISAVKFYRVRVGTMSSPAMSLSDRRT